MVESKEWNWKVVEGKQKQRWLEPAMEVYYVLHRWHEQGKFEFLDLGCGLGRHTILFAKNGFKTNAFDLSEVSIEKTEEYAKAENVKIETKIGDMLALPYKNESFDCILCMNVISHTDTEGIKKIISELYRVLKKDGEVYLTLGSKETWGFMQTDWPLVDPNTRLRMEEGPEYGVPHFYVDYKLAKKLFNNFEIIKIFQQEDFAEKQEKVYSSKHYHLLIKKA